MADADVKQLLLQVDASVELLRKNLKEGESRVASFEREVEKRMDRVDRSFLKAGTGLTGISKAITAVQSRLSGFAGSLGNVAAAIGLAFSVDAFVGMVQRALDYASSLGEVAQQLGVTTEELQVLRYAATQTGISQEQLDKALGKLRVTMGQVAAGAKAPIAALKAIGLSAEDLAGKSGGEQLALIAEGLSKIPDSAQRAAVEVGLFGKAGAALDTLLSGGKKGIDDLSNAAKRLGIVLSDEQIQKADDTADKLAALKLVLEANIAGTVADNARAILTLADALAQLVVWSGKAATAWVVFYKTQQATLAERVRDNPFMSGAIRLKAAEAASDARNDIFEVTSGGKPNPAVNRNVIWDQKLGRFVNKKPNADFGGEPDGVPGVAGMLSGGGGATLPLALVAMAIAPFLMPKGDRNPNMPRPPLDWQGLSLLAIAVVGLLAAFAGGNRDGWDSDKTLLRFGIGIVAGILFFLWERGHPFPALNPKIFTYRQFWSAGLIISATGIAIYGSTYLIPMFVQLVQGYSPTAAGVMMIPAGIAMMIGFPIAGRLTDRMDARWLLGFGIISFAVSAWLLSHVSAMTPYWVLVGWIVLSRIGISFCMPPSNTTAARAVPPHLLASAAGGVSFLMQVGGAFGVNLLAIILQRRTIFHGDHLSAALNETNAEMMYQHALQAQTLEMRGMAQVQAFQSAFGVLNQKVAAEALVYAFRDCFFIIFVWFVFVLGALALMPKPKMVQPPS